MLAAALGRLSSSRQLGSAVRLAWERSAVSAATSAQIGVPRETGEVSSRSESRTLISSAPAPVAAEPPRARGHLLPSPLKSATAVSPLAPGRRTPAPCTRLGAWVLLGFPGRRTPAPCSRLGAWILLGSPILLGHELLLRRTPGDSSILLGHELLPRRTPGDSGLHDLLPLPPSEKACLWVFFSPLVPAHFGPSSRGKVMSAGRPSRAPSAFPWPCPSPCRRPSMLAASASSSPTRLFPLAGAPPC